MYESIPIPSNPSDSKNPLLAKEEVDKEEVA